MGWLSGFGVTLRQIGRPKVTEHFPKEKRPKPVRFHGRHVLNRYEDGMEKCIGCELCAAVCPAKCIYVRGADNDPDEPTSPGERFRAHPDRRGRDAKSRDRAGDDAGRRARPDARA